MFMTAYNFNLNHPELLYNGACGSQDYFQCDTAGDDFCMISDLGNVNITEVTAMKAFDWTWTVDGQNIFKYNSADIVVGHAYAFLLSRSDLRTLYVVSVENQVQDGECNIYWVALSYSIITQSEVAPGFSWDEDNHW